MVLVLAELSEGKFKKTAVEIVSYAAVLAKEKSMECIAIVLGKTDTAELEKLGSYGIKKIIYAGTEKLDHPYSKLYAKIISDAALSHDVKIVILSHNSTGRAIAPRIAVRLNASLLPGVISLPDADFVFKKSVFSGKAYEFITGEAATTVITLNPNSFKPVMVSEQPVIENLEITFADADFDYKILSVENESEGMVPLPEAEIVVSGGRGLKSAENWNIIEDLAKELGATTACSRPVADIGWRPHHEHVGQTGITIKPNLYIAIGISGAIQHLAGVNQSKYIVVINKDPEAPFFKAADYGVVGDAFEIVPKLTEAIRKFHAAG